MPSPTASVRLLSAVILRNYLIESIRRNKLNQLFMEAVPESPIEPYPSNLIYLPTYPLFLERYQYAVGICQELLTSPHGIMGPDDRNDMLLHIITADLNQATLPACLVAWLTTDEFRWHKEVKTASIPEDISYGLVTQYHAQVINAAAFIVGYSSLYTECFRPVTAEYTYAKRSCAYYAQDLHTSIPEEVRMHYLASAKSYAKEVCSPKPLKTSD